MSTSATSTMSSSFPSVSSTQQAAPLQPRNPYGYVPTEWICILFIALFAVSTIAHTVQAAHSRLWWLFLTAFMAGIGEILGWSARLWSSQNVYLRDPYIMQITTTIIAPTPLIAANFIILGQIIRRMGQKYSRVSARWYTIIFCTADIIALVIQALGGGSASTAIQNGRNPDTGGYIMLAGVSFQMAALVIYVVLASEFILRYAYDHPFPRYGESTVARRRTDNKTKLMVLGLVLEAVFLFIRGIYRVVELSNGWTGKIITTEWLFVVFDGTMIVLAMLTINIFHPALLLGKADTWLSRDSDEGVKALRCSKESV
ncbi:transporter [Ganoderma sinense ZZ0214-1]|uniref:Transporter n=1 Tax=Ganoderma sinense ZZ0214-1 TaxID=1077348 RepID=A0A2G8RWY1_9APHY|nr:transporter [Ganoderma sinense ZZ0214-1]